MPIYECKGRKGRTYQIVYFINGKRRKETIGKDRKLAEVVLHKRLTEIAENRYLDKQKENKIRFEDFADQYLNTHCKNNNKSWQKSDKINLKYLKRYFLGKYLYEITPLDVEKLKAKELGEGLSPATVNRRLACLKSLFNRAIEWGKAKQNPVCKIKLFKENNQRLRYLEEEEIVRLLAACPEHLKPVIKVALNTGMRRGEILNLKWRDIDIKRDIIYLLDTKNKEQRDVPMNNEVKKVFMGILRHSDSPYIFYNTDNKRYRDVRNAFAKALKCAKITNFRFHDLRHTFGSHMVMSGVDLNTVRELMGHKSIQMTLRYAHLSPKYKKRAVDILGRKLAENGPATAPNLPQKEIAEIENHLSSLQVFDTKRVTNTGP